MKFKSGTKSTVLTASACTAVFLMSFFVTKSILQNSHFDVSASPADKVIWCHCEPGGACQTLEIPGSALSGHVDANGNILHAGDHAGACEPSVTPSPTPSLTPTLTPSVTPSVTPIPTVTPTTAPSPTPTDVPSPTPTDVPSPTPTETPSEVSPTPTVAEPTPTVAQVLGTSDPDVCTNIDGVQTTVPDGWFQNGANSTECRQFQFNGATQNAGTTGQVLGASTTQGQVLGTSTLADTGSAENELFMVGLILLAVSFYGSSYAYLKAKN